MKIKKGKLNYDQSGRAYPDNPRLKENWDSIWKYEGKYYKLVGDNEHKEWDEVNIYNQMIDEAYEKYKKHIETQRDIQKKEVERLRSQGKKVTVALINLLTKEEFINKCKTDSEFSKKWELKIEERELSDDERSEIRDMQYFKNNLYRALKGSDTKIDWENIPTKLITITYNNEKIESYG
jgi:hypothetical protein